MTEKDKNKLLCETILSHVNLALTNDTGVDERKGLQEAFLQVEALTRMLVSKSMLLETARMAQYVVETYKYEESLKCLVGDNAKYYSNYLAWQAESAIYWKMSAKAREDIPPPLPPTKPTSFPSTPTPPTLSIINGNVLIRAFTMASGERDMSGDIKEEVEQIMKEE